MKYHNHNHNHNNNTYHHTPAWKCLLRLILGLVLTAGFLFFWYGIKNTEALHIVLGSISFVVGLVHLIVTLARSRGY